MPGNDQFLSPFVEGSFKCKWISFPVVAKRWPERDDRSRVRDNEIVVSILQIFGPLYYAVEPQVEPYLTESQNKNKAKKAETQGNRRSDTTTTRMFQQANRDDAVGMKRTRRRTSWGVAYKSNAGSLDVRMRRP